MLGGEADGLLIRTIDQMVRTETPVPCRRFCRTHPSSLWLLCLPLSLRLCPHFARNSFRFVVCPAQTGAVPMDQGEHAASGPLHPMVSSAQSGAFAALLAGAPSGVFSGLGSFGGFGSGGADAQQALGLAAGQDAGALLRGVSMQRLASLSSDDLVSFQLQFQQQLLEQQQSAQQQGGGGGGSRQQQLAQQLSQNQAAALEQILHRQFSSQQVASPSAAAAAGPHSQQLQQAAGSGEAGATSSATDAAAASAGAAAAAATPRGGDGGAPHAQRQLVFPPAAAQGGEIFRPQDLLPNVSVEALPSECVARL